MSIDVDEVRPLAEGRWEQILSALAPQLQPALERAGRHVPCPVHGGKDGYRVFKDVEYTGGSICNTCGSFSDGFATVMWANGWDFATTLKEVAACVGVGNYYRSITPRSAPAPVAKQPDDADGAAIRSLNRVWLESVPMLDRDAEPARLYLARRGIGIIAPTSMRFHPSLPYYDGEKKVGNFPAIICMLSDAEGKPVTIHRVYLTADGRKAPVESPKKLMRYPENRKVLGGAIQLTPVASGVLAIAEGLETALAVIEGTGLPVWCAVNATLLANFVPPDGVRQVLVFADKDLPTKQHPKGHGQEAARQLVQRLWKMGIKASAIVPAGEIQSGQKSLDWLDILVRDGKDGFPTLSSIEARARRAA